MMTCRVFTTIDGGVGIACSRGRRPAKTPCQQAGCTTPHSHLCDKPVANGMKTCDRKMCDTHRVQVGPNRDYCQEHGQPELEARAVLRKSAGAV